MKFIEENPTFFFDGDDISCMFYFKSRIPELKDINSIKRKWGDAGAKTIYIISPKGFDFDQIPIMRSDPYFRFLEEDLELLTNH